MLTFEFSENGLAIVSPPYFVYEFPRKIFLITYSINSPNSSPDCVYFLRY